MKVIYIDAKFEGDLKLGKEVITYLKKNKIKSLGIFASTQFSDISDIENQLSEEKIKSVKTKASRTNDKVQILGCDCYQGNFEKDYFEKIEGILYIGDGLFHPKALLLAQRNSPNPKPVVLWDPFSKKMRVISEKDILGQINKMKQNLKAFILSKEIGILVTTKPGQQYLKQSLKLKKELEKKGKNVYVFLTDNVNFQDFENFNFVQCWVNTACPRIGTDDIVHIDKPIVNLIEAFNPEKALDKFS
jgi:2-(3-amino-3-carboxypropyl)histidine synthase